MQQTVRGRFDVPNWDVATQKKLREALLVLGATLPDSKSMFGTRSEVDPVRYVIGAAMAWGGNPVGHCPAVRGGSIRDSWLQGWNRLVDYQTTGIEGVYFASDVVVLTSDNEGTPVSLIEAQAARTPVVSTSVGGVRSVVLDGETGFLADEPTDLAAHVRSLLDDRDRAAAMATRGREHVLATFGIARLVDDLDSLYRRLLT